MPSLIQLQCQVCAHEWVPRKSVQPRWCPNCNSTHWATGRVRPPIAEQRARAAARRTRPARLAMRYTVAGVTTAGPWAEVVDEPTQEMAFQELLDLQEGDYLLRIHPDDGSCLIGDGIYPQDLVLLRPGLQHENGDIVKASGVDSSGRAFSTLKHIHHEPGSDTVELRPSNPLSPIIVAPAAAITVHGTVVGFIHRGKVRRAGC